MSGIASLALLVVYVTTEDDDGALVALHLDRIRSHTAVPHRIYAAAPRVSAATRRRLESDPAVELVPTPDFTDRGSREHAHHLDALLARARADGPDAVATFDVDSFPVDDRWLRTFEGAAGNSLAGILRRENGDTHLPHPSGLLITRPYLDAHRVTFAPDGDGTERFRRFQQATGQAADTGIRIACDLWSEGIDWGAIERTNTRELHPVIAGLYGDVVFHLGATARAHVFRRDRLGSAVYRRTAPLERPPLPGPLHRARRGLVRRLRRREAARFATVNRAAAVEAREWLLRDPDGLVSFLRGQGPDTAG